MKKLLTVISMSLLLTGPSFAQHIQREDQPDIIESIHDRRMEDAIAEARASLDVYFEEMERIGSYRGEFAIKVGLPTNDDSFEHIWVIDVSGDPDGTMTGFLQNEPFDIVGNLSLGDKVSFQRDEVTDWLYRDGAKYRGHFTTRILIETYPQETIDAFMSSLHANPLPTSSPATAKGSSKH